MQMRLKAADIQISSRAILCLALTMLALFGVGWRGYTMSGDGSNWWPAHVSATSWIGQSSEAEQEPNETVEQANQLTLPGQVAGTVRYGDPAVVEFTYNNGPKDKIEDLYRFNVSNGDSGKVDIQLTFSNPAADLDLILYRKEPSSLLTPLVVSNGSTTTERITPTSVLTAGEYLIGVTAYDDPGNTVQSSYRLVLRADELPPAPVIRGINPVSALAGSGAISLTVNGENFISGQSVVRWNDQPRTTTVINSGQVVAFLTAADLNAPGTASVTVVNPAALGGSSNITSFSILPPGTPEVEVEPNESSAQAGLLLVPGKRSGAVATGDASGVTISLSNGLSDSIEDLFAISLMESKRLDLQLTGENPGADLALYLIQENGTSGQVTVIGNSRLKGASQQITTPIALPAGRYLVGVSAVSGQSNYLIAANIPGDRLLQVNAGSAAPGSVVTVPVSFSSLGNESRMSFSLGFDQTILSSPEFVSGAALSTAQVRVNQTEVGQGRLGIEIELPVGQAFSSGLVEIGRVNFLIRAGDGVRSTTVDFQDRPVVRTLVDRDSNALIGSYGSGTVVASPGVESDLVPRPNGGTDRSVTIADWTQTGRFVANLDAVASGSEFQRADSAPKGTLGDGRLTIADWVMAGRYASGLEVASAAGGPSAPALPATVAGEAVKAFELQSEAQQESRTIRVRPDLFSRGRENELIIELVSQGNENAVGFSLNFDFNQLNYVRTTLGNDSAGAILNVNTNRLAEGRLGFGLALSSNQSFAAGTRQVLKVVFTVPSGGSVNATTVSFGDLPVSREVVDPQANILPAGYTPGEIRLDPPAELVPTLTAIEPASLQVNGPLATLSAKGTNFIDGAVIEINGVSRMTTFVSTTELRTVLLAEDLAEPLPLEVQVRNPAPGNGSSGKLTVQVLNPLPVIESISPDAVGVGGQSFTLTVTGRNFVRGSQIEFNQKLRATTLVSSTRLTAVIPSTEITSISTVPVRVVTSDPGGGRSAELTLAIKALNPLPRILSISPSSVEVGSGDQIVVITGTSFVNGATVQVNSDRLPTNFVSATELRVVIEASRLTTPGAILLSVGNPAPGGGNSNWVTLTVTPPRNPVPVLTSISPATVQAGGPTFTLTLNGAGFVASSTVQVNGTTQPSTFVSSTVMTTQISAQSIIASDNLSVRVISPAPGGGTTDARTLAIVNPVPVLTALTPNTVIDGSQSFVLSLVGTGFVPGSKVIIDGVARTANFVAGTQLSIQISAAEVATVRTLLIQVLNPTPGGGTSNTLKLIVRQPNPLPRIGQVRPAEVKVGGPGFLLSVDGVRFVSDSVIRINGQPRQTEFISESLLVTQIEAAEIATPGELAISVFNPAPGGGQSSGVTVYVTNPVPRITTITPQTALAGGEGIDLILFGDGFTSTSVVRFNNLDIPTTLVSSSQLTARISRALLSGGGNQQILVFNPVPGGGSSNILNLTVRNPMPTINRLTPTQITAGDGPVTVTIDGNGLVTGSVARVNGQDRPTTWVSATRLSVLLTAADIANGATLNVGVFNPAPEGGSSNNLPLLINNPAPIISSLTPDTLPAGSAAFRLLVVGKGFVPASVINWNGVPRSTIFVSATELAVDVVAAEVESVGSATLTVFNPLPGGGVSAPTLLNIRNPIPVVSSLTPGSSVIGGTGFTLIINGTGFLPSSVVQWNGVARSTRYVGWTELRVDVAAADTLTVGVASVSVVNPAPGGGTSGILQFSINNPIPSLIRTIPQSVIAGGSWFALTVQGSGFVPGAVVNWNGQARPTTFVSSTDLRIDVPAADIAVPSAVQLTVSNPVPGGGISSPIVLNVTTPPNPVPVLESMTPSSAIEGDSSLTIRVTGGNFVNGVTLLWQGTARPTTYVSPTQLTAQIDAADVAVAGNFTVTVVNPAPGGGSSNPLTFYVNSTAVNCQTLCMQSAGYYLQNLTWLPRGIIWINRYFYNITSGSAVIKRALEGNATIGQQLTREFTASQLTTAAGGNAPGVLNSELSCYRLNFASVKLSNGESISRQTRIVDLFSLTRSAIADNREADMALLLPVFQLLNGNDPLNRCR